MAERDTELERELIRDLRELSREVGELTATLKPLPNLVQQAHQDSQAIALKQARVEERLENLEEERKRSDEWRRAYIAAFIALLGLCVTSLGMSCTLRANILPAASAATVSPAHSHSVRK